MRRLPERGDDTRLPEQGRIRMGKKRETKNGKSAPSKLTTFRFTSSDVQAIQRLAEYYGGTPKAWDDPTHLGQWELETTSEYLRIVLPPNALGPWMYEVWGGGRTLIRRCDGEFCTEWAVGRDRDPNASEPEEKVVDCHCHIAQELSCVPTTTLSILLPDVQLGGTWRLVTHGHNAQKELPASLALIRVAAEQSGRDSAFLDAILYADQRTNPRNAKEQYVVPVVRTTATMMELAAGGGRAFATLGAANATQAALPVASSVNREDIADAEVVESVPVNVTSLADRRRDQLLKEMVLGIHSVFPTIDPDQALEDLTQLLSMGQWKGGWRDLPAGTLERLGEKVQGICEGTLEWHAPDDTDPYGRLVTV